MCVRLCLLYTRGWSMAVSCVLCPSPGISGFETSANFVEEQASGVFVKTLRNMWVAVAFFNPVLSLMSLMVLPMQQIYDHQVRACGCSCACMRVNAWLPCLGRECVAAWGLAAMLPARVTTLAHAARGKY